MKYDFIHRVLSQKNVSCISIFIVKLRECHVLLAEYRSLHHLQLRWHDYAFVWHEQEF